MLRLKLNITDLVNHGLNKIPESVWSSSDSLFLDPAMGGGQFVREIENKLRLYGHSDKNISGRVYGCENSKLRVQYAVNKYKLIGKYVATDSLKMDFGDMKKNFSVIAQNPPYLNGLWKSFIKNAWDNLLAEDGYMITINPDPIESIGAGAKKWQQECRRMNLQYRKSATEYFPGVNSGPIGMFFYDKRNPFKIEALESNDIKHVIKNKMMSNSKNNNVFRYSHLGKYDHLKPIEEKRKRKQSNDMKDNSTTFSDRYSEKVVVSMISSGVDIKYFEPVEQWAHNHRGSVFVMNRFFGQNIECDLIDNIHEYKIGRKVLYLEALENETLESFKSVFCSKLYRFTLKVMRDGHMDTRPTHLTQLFCPPLTRVYSEQELYQINGITDPVQISYIEKNYLGNKWS